MSNHVLKLLDWICPRIEPAQTIPYGLSRGRWRHNGGHDTDKFRIHLPLFWWKGNDYLVSKDCERYDWWLQTLVIHVQRVPGGFDIGFRSGAFPRGRGWVKDWMDPGWRPERT